MKKNSFANLIILGGFLNLTVGICAYIFTRDLFASGIWLFIGLGFLLSDSKVKSTDAISTVNFFRLKKLMSVMFMVIAFSMFAYLLYADFTSVSYNATGSVPQLH